jgi:hypothetical protein
MVAVVQELLKQEELLEQVVLEAVVMEQLVEVQELQAQLTQAVVAVVAGIGQDQDLVQAVQVLLSSHTLDHNNLQVEL